MSRVTELEKALTTLFRKGTEVGYTETEIDEFLENIDYHALLQAVWNKAETVYAYRADGKNALSLDNRSSELFKQRATLLYEDVGDSYIGAVFAARSMELWLLEDMGFAVVAKFSVNAGEGEYVTEYRVYKGSDWADSEISLDLEDLVAELAALCDPYYEHEQLIDGLLVFVVGIAEGGKLGHQVLQIQRNLAVRPIAALVDTVLGDVFAFSSVHAEFGNDGKAHILQ